MSLSGFRVISSFDIENFACQSLESTVYQLGVILYPPDLFNEKFLINVRNCMLKLNDGHPVKKWLKQLSNKPKPDAKKQQTIDFVNEMLNSQFNLITDLKVKSSVIKLLSDIPEKTKLEKLLKSYLFLMLGNIARSDAYLQEIIQQKPRVFYQGYGSKNSLYHELTEQHLDKVLAKFSRHPADRTTFFLLTAYLENFTNKEDLLGLVNDVQPDLGHKLSLSYTQRIAPELVKAVKMKNAGVKRRARNLRTKSYPQEFQSQWLWPFVELGPYFPDQSAAIIKELEEKDPLWAIYLLADEKLADQYLKTGALSMTRRRQILRQHLEAKEDYMLTLYKLIELGDVEPDLIQSTVNFLSHE